MDLKALKDLRTTGPGLAIMIVHYLIANQIISPALGDIFYQAVALVVGIVLLACNSQAAGAPAALPAALAAPATLAVDVAGDLVGPGA